MTLTVQTVTSPRYSNANGTSIDCMVKFAEFDSAIPFTAVDGDLPHTQIIWDGLTAGTYGAIAAYVAPATPVPQVISDRQFAQALAMNAIITQNEAIAWVSNGTIPAPLQAIVDAIPDANARFSATMLLAGAVEFYRDHPLVSVVRDARGMTDSEVDAIFIQAGAL
jgi:hypothetical protein